MKKLDSNKLTKEQQEFFATHLAFLATTNADGLPFVGPKQSMRVLDDGHLTYLEKTKAHAFENIKNGSKVAVVVADKPSHTNVRVVGTAHVQDENEDGHYPVVIDVETIEE